MTFTVMLVDDAAAKATVPYTSEDGSVVTLVRTVETPFGKFNLRYSRDDNATPRGGRNHNHAAVLSPDDHVRITMLRQTAERLDATLRQQQQVLDETTATHEQLLSEIRSMPPSAAKDLADAGKDGRSPCGQHGPAAPGDRRDQCDAQCDPCRDPQHRRCASRRRQQGKDAVPVDGQRRLGLGRRGCSVCIRVVRQRPSRVQGATFFFSL
ncbi:hypothetical protein BC831DRAFT_463961, partial [Entophlyctis helioformis]